MSLSKKPAALVFASILMILLGLARGMGGIVLLLQRMDTLPDIRTSETVIIYLAIILILIGVAEIISAVGVYYLKIKYLFAGIVITVLFVIDGAVNGYFIFGKPGEGGTIVNLIVAVIIIALLSSGRRALNSNK